jgi:hypothetical protein
MFKKLQQNFGVLKGREIFDRLNGNQLLRQDSLQKGLLRHHKQMCLCKKLGFTDLYGGLGMAFY